MAPLDIAQQGNDFNSSAPPPTAMYDAGPAPADFITVASTTNELLYLTKSWSRNPVTGALQVQSASNAKTFSFDPWRVNNLDEVHRVLATLRPTQAMVWGKTITGHAMHNVHRRLRDNKKDGASPTLEDTAHYLLPLDVDGVEPKDANGEFDPRVEPERAISLVVSLLGPEFAGAECLIQLTSSAGFKPGIRIRLFFWLSRPLTGAEAKSWLAQCPIADKAIYSPAQLIYAAPPVIGHGLVDPVPQRFWKRPGGVVIPPAEIVCAPPNEHRQAAEGAALDEQHTIDRGRRYLQGVINNGGAPREGSRDNQCVQLANKLGDFGCSEQVATYLLETEWANHGEAPDRPIEDIVASAFSSRDNDLGCDYQPPPKTTEELFAGVKDYAAAGVPGAAPVDPEHERIKAKFMSPERGAVKSYNMDDRISRITTKPERVDLIPDWVIAREPILFCGRGGIHKSRLIMQLVLSLRHQRQLFAFRLNGDERASCWGGNAPGLPVARFEHMSYEDPADEIDRRMFELWPHFADPSKPPIGEWTYHDFEPNKEAGQLLRVNEDATVDLLPAGYEFLARWERLAAQGGHTVIWLDSFVNAVVLVGNSKVNDACVDAVIGVLRRWCKLLDATILAPFHTSRSGADRGDTGYSPRFEDAPRQVLMLSTLTRPIDGQPGKREPTGQYRFAIYKWNTGLQGKKLIYEYFDGQLVTTQPMDTAGAMHPMTAAVDIVARYTYETARDIDGVKSPSLSDEDREALERQHPMRISKAGGKGGRWKYGMGGPGGSTVLKPGAAIIDEFRSLTGQPHATVEDFIYACQQAQAALKLGYREYTDTGANGAHRLPAGFYIPKPRVEEGIEEE